MFNNYIPILILYLSCTVIILMTQARHIFKYSQPSVKKKSTFCIYFFFTMNNRIINKSLSRIKMYYSEIKFYGWKMKWKYKFKGK